MRTTRRSAVALLSLSLLGAAPAGQQPDSVLPNVPAAVKGERCVEPLDIIRRDHMSLLLHQRDRTVHFGERGAKHSLKECLSCHTQRNAQGAYIPVNSKGQFCYECHAYAAVKMDCFECHASTPATNARVNSRTDP